MTSWVVCDSGILIASALNEVFTKRAQRILSYWNENDIQIAVPTLFHYEIVATIRKKVHQGKLTQEDADVIIEVLLERSVSVHSDIPLIRRAYALATELKMPTAYDAQFLAVAEHLNCDFWTLDERLYNVASPTFTWVKWLGNSTI
jgi:predicted nucleic acid-binding protein